MGKPEENEQDETTKWVIRFGVAGAVICLVILLCLLCFGLGFFIGNGVYQGAMV